jgi:hypothetical protein
MRLSCFVSDGMATVADITEAGQSGIAKLVAERREAPDKPASIWTSDQEDRKAQAEVGRCVVANMHDGFDVALLAWAQSNDRFVRINQAAGLGRRSNL